MIPLASGSHNFLAEITWDFCTGSFYAVDIISPPGVCSIYRFDYKTQKIYGAVIEGETNPFFIKRVRGHKSRFIVGFQGVIKLIKWDGVSKTATVIQTLYKAYGAMKYALADRAGRLYFGTSNCNTFCSAGKDYALYCYDKGSVRTILTNIKTTTGLTIDYKRNKFYVANACEFRIDEFDYDPKTGDISKFS